MTMKNNNEDKDENQESERNMKNISISSYVFDILYGLKMKGKYGTFDKTIRALLSRVDEQMKKDIQSAIDFLGIEPDTKKSS